MKHRAQDCPEQSLNSRNFFVDFVRERKIFHNQFFRFLLFAFLLVCVPYDHVKLLKLIEQPPLCIENFSAVTFGMFFFPDFGVHSHPSI
jgi:hypothetical protein